MSQVSRSIWLYALCVMTLACLFGFLGLAGCNKDRTSSHVETAAPSDSQSGHPALGFDYLDASELLFSKFDPESGDWTTRIIRKKRGRDRNGSDSVWTIELAPDGQVIQDRRANAAFILHLLDTVRTVQFKEANLSGPLESFGLAHPFYSLRWKIETGAGVKDYRLDFGAPRKGPDGSVDGLYARLVLPMQGQISVTTGALIEMLEMVHGFSTFRLPTLATFGSDDIDEIRISSGKKPLWYAQRDGDHWSDRAHRPLQTDVQGFLDQLTHLRIMRFIDNPAEAKTTLARLNRKPLYELRLSGRSCAPVTIRISTLAGQAFATISDRAAVFETYPQILRLISRIKQL